MREPYEKPTILFESFALSQSIAKNCGDTHDSSFGESTHYNENTCTWDMGYMTLFLTTTTVECELDMDEFGEFEGVCYNNPDDGQQVFSSI